MERLSGKLDVQRIVREISRTKFADMPKQKSIGDKRRKAPRYKQDWRNE